IAVNRDLRQQGPADLERGIKKQTREGARHQLLVRPHVAQQTAHQAAVICFAEDLFFHCLYRGMTLSALSSWGSRRAPGTLTRNPVLASLRATEPDTAGRGSTPNRRNPLSCARKAPRTVFSEPVMSFLTMSLPNASE